MQQMAPKSGLEAAQLQIERLKSWSSKNPVISAIALLSVIFSFVAGILSSFSTIGNFFLSLSQNHSNVSTQKAAELQIVENLRPGVTLANFQNALGTATFTIKNSASQKREYIWVHSYYYADAVIDDTDTVQFLAITIRDKSFHPVFMSPGYPENQPSIKITLGVTVLQSLPDGYSIVNGCSGAHNKGYYERQYYGNPGDYEDFAFGFNEAGYLPPTLDFSVFNNHPGFCPGMNITNYSTAERTLLQPFREQEPFNTYAVTAPNASITDFTNDYLGVPYDTVRTLP